MDQRKSSILSKGFFFFFVSFIFFRLFFRLFLSLFVPSLPFIDQFKALVTNKSYLNQTIRDFLENQKDVKIHTGDPNSSFFSRFGILGYFVQSFRDTGEILQSPFWECFRILLGIEFQTWNFSNFKIDTHRRFILSLQIIIEFVFIFLILPLPRISRIIAGWLSQRLFSSLKCNYRPYLPH